jgi:hypothetical protein
VQVTLTVSPLSKIKTNQATMIDSPLVIIADERPSIVVKIYGNNSWLLSNPLGCQVFAKAVITASKMKTVHEICVTINDTPNSVTYEKDCVKVFLNPANWKTMAEIIANSLQQLGNDSNYPPAMKDELAQRFYKIIFGEIEKIFAENIQRPNRQVKKK